MTEEGPEVHELNKQEASDPAGEAYPEDIEDETPDTGEDTDYDFDTDADLTEIEEKSEEEKTLKEKLSLAHKVSTKKDFTELSDRDTVLFDTPVEGMKTGDITNREETWSGVLQVEVDTGAKAYTLTPFEDDFSAKYVATVGSTLELSQEVLDGLEAASIQDVSKGEDVILDVPRMGPTRATATDIVESANQGKRGTFRAADGLHFVVYEEPSATQTKEQPYIIGRERE